MNVQSIPVHTIAAPSLVRTENGHDKEGLRQLADSILRQGLLQPIVIRMLTTDEAQELPQEGFAWMIIAGRRRLAATKLAKLDTIDCVILETDDAQSYEMEIAENLQRQDMTTADTARMVRTLLAIHDSATTVATILSKSKAWVSKYLAVTSHDCPTEVVALMDQGIVTDLETLILLKQIAHTTGPAAAAAYARLVNMANAGNLSRPIARTALAKLRTPPAPPSPTITTTTTNTTGPTTTTTDTDDAAPASTFAVTLPIDLLATFETLGGTDWLIQRLRDTGNLAAAM